MRIIFDRPPNYAAILAAFPTIAGRAGVIFAYGPAIYNPGRVKITPALMAHESVHAERQESLFPSGGPDDWWDHYIANQDFRLGEEILAHRAEYRRICETPGVDKPVMGFRSGRAWHLAELARRLASPMYGTMVSVAEAKRLIIDQDGVLRAAIEQMIADQAAGNS